MTSKAQRTRIAQILGSFSLAAGLLSVSPSFAGGEPTSCDFVKAFDVALQDRYAHANLTPERPGCAFTSAVGCSYAWPRRVVVRVTHLQREGCDASGACTFLARQVCVSGRADGECRALMATNPSTYRVTGKLDRDGETWRLTDWIRTPSAAPADSETAAAHCDHKV